MGLILLCSFFEIDQHNCEALNAISCSENHMTDSSDLPSLLKILFRTYSNRQNRSILGSVSKGNYTSATDIFADHIAVLIFQSALQGFFLTNLIAILIIISRRSYLFFGCKERLLIL